MAKQYARQRGDTSVQYIDTARGLVSFTETVISKCPKKYKRRFADILESHVIDVFTNTYMANEIYPRKRSIYLDYARMYYYLTRAYDRTNAAQILMKTLLDMCYDYSTMSKERIMKYRKLSGDLFPKEKRLLKGVINAAEKRYIRDIEKINDELAKKGIPLVSDILPSPADLMKMANCFAEMRFGETANPISSEHMMKEVHGIPTSLSSKGIEYAPLNTTKWYDDPDIAPLVDPEPVELMKGDNSTNELPVEMDKEMSDTEINDAIKEMVETSNK